VSMPPVMHNVDTSVCSTERRWETWPLSNGSQAGSLPRHQGTT
jgi:hypothetical protein